MEDTEYIDDTEYITINLSVDTPTGYYHVKRQCRADVPKFVRDWMIQECATSMRDFLAGVAPKLT